MKKKYFLLFVLATFSVHSQVNFENGYYITTANEKIECKIKDYDWVSNPTKIEYKANENAEINELSIDFIKEFGITNVSKYIKETVAIDRSSNALSNLNDQRDPVNKNEVLLLKVIVEGKATLYSYTDGNLNRFFYSIDDGALEQLVYKLYQNNNSYAENNRYKQQLWNSLKCTETTLNQIERLRYDEDKLKNYFIKYNSCNNIDYVVFEKKKEKTDLFNLTIRPGISINSLSIQGVNTSDARTTDFDTKLNLRLGIETEFILGFNNNKWSIIAEPTFQSYNSEKNFTTYGVNSTVPRNESSKINYQYIELPVGIRHYFFLNDHSKLFINGSLIFNFNLKGKVEFTNYNDIDIKEKINLGFGFGYKFKDKYSLEYRYHPNKELLNYIDLTSNFQNSSLIFGYTLF